MKNKKQHATTTTLGSIEQEASTRNLRWSTSKSKDVISQLEAKPHLEPDEQERLNYHKKDRTTTATMESELATLMPTFLLFPIDRVLRTPTLLHIRLALREKCPLPVGATRPGGNKLFNFERYRKTLAPQA